MKRQGWKKEIKSMLCSFPGKTPQGQSPLLYFSTNIPTTSRKGQGLWSKSARVWDEGPPILDQRKPLVLGWSQSISSLGLGTSQSEMVAVGSWLRVNSEAICPCKGYKWATEVTAPEKRTCSPQSPSGAEGKQPSRTLHRRAKTKSSIRLSSSGPGKPSAAASLHHTGWKQWPWSIHTRFYLGPAAGCRPELNRATQLLRTTTRTRLHFSAQAFSPPIPSHSDGTLTYLLSPPDHELPSKHNVYPHPKHNTWHTQWI